MSAESQSRLPVTSAWASAPPAEAPRCLLTLAANVLSSTGPEPSAAFTAAAAALARDAQRAARHLGFEPWEGIVAECTAGVLGFAPTGPDSDRLAAVILPANTPAGAAQRMAVRYAAMGVSA